MKRKSNIELFRIITMILIVAHHYVVNSGLSKAIFQDNTFTLNNIFLLIFGGWGKYGINCFVLITGYFMCKSTPTIRKFLRLFGEVEFYRIIIYFLFILCGYSTFTVKDFIKTIDPFINITNNDFVSCFLLFYFLIYWINILVRHLTKKGHLLLITLLLFIYTFLPSFCKSRIEFNYTSWFCVIYLIAAYIRIYPNKLFENVRLWRATSMISILISCLSIGFIFYCDTRFGFDFNPYYFVADSNKILAVLTSVSCFIWAINTKVKYNKFINQCASSMFAVLLIHANSDTMRTWLWKDVAKNIEFLNSPWLPLHAITVIFIVFSSCVIIDQMRQYITNLISNNSMFSKYKNYIDLLDLCVFKNTVSR